ncbi:hypothetical protein VTI28DRAFT_8382 [Corynascus sepedonium]
MTSKPRNRLSSPSSLRSYERFRPSRVRSISLVSGAAIMPSSLFLKGQATSRVGSAAVRIVTRGHHSSRKTHTQKPPTHHTSAAHVNTCERCKENANCFASRTSNAIPSFKYIQRLACGQPWNATENKKSGSAYLPRRRRPGVRGHLPP